MIFKYLPKPALNKKHIIKLIILLYIIFSVLVLSINFFRLGKKESKPSGITLHSQYDVWLKSPYENYLLSDTTGALRANASIPREWEEWRLYDIDKDKLQHEDKVYVKSVQHKRFLCAESSLQVIANRAKANVWEEWKIEIVGNDQASREICNGEKIYLKSIHLNQYLRADSNGKVDLTKDKHVQGTEWTLFFIDTGGKSNQTHLVIPTLIKKTFTLIILTGFILLLLLLVTNYFHEIINHYQLIIKVVLVNIALIIFVILLFELYLRINKIDRRDVVNNISNGTRIHDFFYYDENGCFRIKPNAKGWHRSAEGSQVLIEINSDGIRGPEIRENPDKRIAVVGDSIPFNGENKWEDTFVAQVEAEFKKNYPTVDIECLNFGTSDAGIEQYYKKVKYHVLDLKPDVVVLCLYLNDSRPPQGFMGESGRMAWEYVLERSFLYKLLTVKKTHESFRQWYITRHSDIQNRFKWVNRFHSKNYINDENEWHKLVKEAEFDWGAAWQPNSWQFIEDYMDKILRLCKKNNIQLLCACFPVSVQTEASSQFGDIYFPQQQALKLCKKLNVPFLDLLPYMKKRNTGDVFIDQCHLTIEGNMIVSKALYDLLKKYIGLDFQLYTQNNSLNSQYHVWLKSSYGYYLLSDATGTLHANAGIPREWEEWIICDIDTDKFQHEDKIYIKSAQHKQFLCAESSLQVITNREKANAWEEWKIEIIDCDEDGRKIYNGEKVYLKSIHLNRYLRTDSNGKVDLTKDRHAQGTEWTLFFIE